MKRNNIYQLSDRFQTPPSMRETIKQMGFRAMCREVIACIVVIASAIFAVFALGVFGAM